MPIHRTSAVVDDQNSLRIEGLPFAPGDEVEVIIAPVSVTVTDGDIPLRGTPVTLIDPDQPVDEAQWEAAR